MSCPSRRAVSVKKRGWRINRKLVVKERKGPVGVTCWVLGQGPRLSFRSSWSRNKEVVERVVTIVVGRIWWRVVVFIDWLPTLHSSCRDLSPTPTSVTDTWSVVPRTGSCLILPFFPKFLTFLLHSKPKILLVGSSDGQTGTRESERGETSVCVCVRRRDTGIFDLPRKDSYTSLTLSYNLFYGPSTSSYCLFSPVVSFVEGPPDHR